MRFLPLIENETLKILRRRRFAIVLGILLAIMSAVAWGYHRQLRNRNPNWRADVQEQIVRMENRLRRGRVEETWAKSMRAEIRRLQFYLDHDMNPFQPTAPQVTRNFANVAGALLLLPLLVVVLGGDIVSAENAEGTDKLLLTRPVRRWKILASKLVTLWMFSTLTLLMGGVISYAVAAPLLPAGGWNAPTFAGYQFTGDSFNVDAVRQLPLWHDALIAYGLEWYTLLCVAAISLMLSVLFKSTPGSIGTMIASIIGGTILTRMTPDWTAGKYLFVSALQLSDYYSGQAPPYEGMSMAFCIGLLAVWAAGALIVAFTIFVRRDVFG